MSSQEKILRTADHLSKVAVVALLCGSVLGFGGAVWWFRPVAAVLAFLLAAAVLVRLLCQGRLPVLKSPLTLLGFLALGLGMLQLVPLPAPLARRLSPVRSRSIPMASPDLVRRDLPAVELPEPAQGVRPQPSIGPPRFAGLLVRRSAWASSGRSRISRIG